jgi:hypothetical protein
MRVVAATVALRLAGAVGPVVSAGVDALATLE